MNVLYILGDFAENYEFVVQDGIQSYHWCKDSCMLHPIVIYYKNRDEVDIQHKSFCFLSDDMTHDRCFVHEIQKQLSIYIKDNLPLISKLYYFSDGCGRQYKNYKNFHNLCYHSEDFGLDAEWAFFATSHGKSPCDGIGGTVKRTTTTASLQRTTINHILTVDSMYAFCVVNIKSITFIQIFKETMIIVRFETSNTLPGTRSHHHYIPLSKNTIAFKQTSEDVKLTHFNLVTCVNPQRSLHQLTLKY